VVAEVELIQRRLEVVQHLLVEPEELVAEHLDLTLREVMHLQLTQVVGLVDLVGVVKQVVMEPLVK
jgi:hypothetical protein